MADSVRWNDAAAQSNRGSEDDTFYRVKFPVDGQAVVQELPHGLKEVWYRPAVEEAIFQLPEEIGFELLRQDDGERGLRVRLHIHRPMGNALM